MESLDTHYYLKYADHLQFVESWHHERCHIHHAGHTAHRPSPGCGPILVHLGRVAQDHDGGHTGHDHGHSHRQHEEAPVAHEVVIG